MIFEVSKRYPIIKFVFNLTRQDSILLIMKIEFLRTIFDNKTNMQPFFCYYVVNAFSKNTH